MKTGFLLSLLVHGTVLVAGLCLVARVERTEPARVLLAVHDASTAAPEAELEPPSEIAAPEPVAEDWPLDATIPVTTEFDEPVEEPPAYDATPPPLRMARLGRPLPRKQTRRPRPATAAPAVRPASAPAAAPAPPARLPASRAPRQRASLEPPRIIAARCAPARYPSLARRLGHEGEVALRLHVTAAGTVSAIEILSTSGHAELDRAAVAAARTWRFLPAHRGGRAVAYQVRVPFRFRLR